MSFIGNMKGRIIMNIKSISVFALACATAFAAFAAKDESLATKGRAPRRAPIRANVQTEDDRIAALTNDIPAPVAQPREPKYKERVVLVDEIPAEVAEAAKHGKGKDGAKARKTLANYSTKPDVVAKRNASIDKENAALKYRYEKQMEMWRERQAAFKAKLDAMTPEAREKFLAERRCSAYKMRAYQFLCSAKSDGVYGFLYDEKNEAVVITLKDGTTASIPFADCTLRGRMRKRVKNSANPVPVPTVDTESPKGEGEGDKPEDGE